MLFCKIMTYLLTIVGIIHPCVMPVIGSNKIILICPLIIPLLPIYSHIIPKPHLLSGPDLADIIVPPYDFPDEIHNEDSHYSCLVIGFFHGKNKHQIPLRFNDPELEAILFPDLFPDGRGFYGDICNRSNSSAKPMTYGRYIKSQLMGYDSRFRLHPV